MAVTKAHILAEIKRTASENGGAALGRERFFAETGIKETDWLGKYWARWGDAVREAGLTANKLQSAIEESELLQRYASLAVELGRLPTSAELQLKTRSDPTFPAHSTFKNRLGRQPELLARLRIYCLGSEGFGDVVGWCDGRVSEQQGEAEEAEPSDSTMGFVYLMKSGRFYKIGKSTSAGRREYEVAVQMPERLTTVHVIRTDDPGGIEAYWHMRFAEKRRNGEWFDLAPGDVTAFKRRKFM